MSGILAPLPHVEIYHWQGTAIVPLKFLFVTGIAGSCYGTGIILEKNTNSLSIVPSVSKAEHTVLRIY